MHKSSKKLGAMSLTKNPTTNRFAFPRCGNYQCILQPPPLKVTTRPTILQLLGATPIPHPSHMSVLQPSLWHLSREVGWASQALEQLDSHRHTIVPNGCTSHAAYHNTQALPGEQPLYFTCKSQVQQAGGRSAFSCFLLLLHCKAFPPQ